MLVQSVHFTFAAEDADKAEAILRELRDASRAEEGVIAFEIARGQQDANEFALWEVYRDREALELHMASDHFKRLVIHGVRSLARERRAEMLAPI